MRTIVEGLSFPEAPRWHDGALWFSDIHAHRVLKLDPAGTLSEVAHIHDRVSGLGFMPDGTLLAVSMLDRTLIAIGRDGKRHLHADLSRLSASFINDMVVDLQGRAYVGSRNGGGPDTATDSLIVVEPDGKSRVVAERMVSPNGAVITPDGRSLIIAETSVGRLLRFSIAPDGSLSDREVFAEHPGLHFDGICRDASGAIWAGGGAGGLHRIAPDGALVETIPSPGRMVLACSLGGADGRTLFLATTSLALLDNLARIGFDRKLDAGVNSDGRIVAMEVEVAGIG